jgi:hypothetical protein
MTPKEKATELTNKMYLKIPSIYDSTALWQYPTAKEMALIAVDEILNLEPPELSYLEPFSKSWWQEVKQEIEKL